MSEYTAQRDAIKAAVTGVANIGRVHDRPRYGDFHDHYVVDGDDGWTVPHIRAWEIGLDDPGVVVERLSAGWRHRYRRWRVSGYVGLVDAAADDPVDSEGAAVAAAIGGASYHLITELAGSVADAIDIDPTLGGTCLHLHAPGDGANAVSYAEPTPLFLMGTILCWGVVLRFTTYTVIA